MKRRSQRGIMLIEALVAVLLLAIGVFGTMALQARASSALSEAAMRAEATIAAEQLLGVMTSDQANLSAYVLAAGGTPGAALAPWYAATRARIPGAAITVAVIPDAADQRTEVDIVIGWQRKAGEQSNTHRVTGYIAGAL